MLKTLRFVTFLLLCTLVSGCGSDNSPTATTATSVVTTSPATNSTLDVLFGSSGSVLPSSTTSVRVSAFNSSAAMLLNPTKFQLPASGTISVTLPTTATIGEFVGLDSSGNETGSYFAIFQLQSNSVTTITPASLNLIGATGATGTTGLPGAAGQTGTTGLTGTLGPLGMVGPMGLIGPTGAAGANGATGSTGIAGTNGFNGATGTTGIAGTNGFNGSDGATGTTGIAGTNGSNGLTGATGTTGIAGTNGSNGSDGATGTTGIAGTNGSNGSDGATGTTGIAGTNGSNGLTGATGTTGIAGTNGSNGLTGATGTTGIAGTNGSNGLTGAIGSTGAISTNSASVEGANTAFAAGSDSLIPFPYNQVLSGFTTSPDSKTLTVPATGRYLLAYQINLQPNQPATAVANILINGNAVGSLQTVIQSGAVTASQMAIVQLTQASTIQLDFYTYTATMLSGGGFPGATLNVVQIQ